MARKQLIFLSAISFSLLLIILAYGINVETLIFNEHADNHWATLLNITSNSYHLWHTSLPIRMSSAYYPFILLIIYFISVLISNQLSVENFILNIIGVLVILTLYGENVVIFSFIATLPLMMRFLCSKGTFPSYLLFIPLLLFQLSITPSIYPLLITLCIILSNYNHADRLNKNFLILIILSLPIYTLLMLNAPDIFFPDYKHSVQIVPDDGIPGIIRPLVGEDHPLATIDWSDLNETYKIFAVALLGILSVALLIELKKPVFFLFCLSLCTVFDLFLQQPWKIFSPLYSVTRLIPGLFIIPVVPLVIAFIVVGCLQIRKNIFKQIAVLTLLIALLQDSGTGILQSRKAKILTSQLNKGISTELKNLVYSPAAGIIKRYGFESTISYKNISDLESFLPDGTLFLASQNKDAHSLSFLNDRDNSTRWTASSGKQSGDEWLCLQLPNKISINGVFLHTGQYATDFPQAISIYCLDSCNEDNLSKDKRITEINPWLGTIKFTDEKYPYYGDKSDVKILFPNSQNCKSYSVHQIGKKDNYDWSVAEIRLLKNK